jgi:hypothetical protein
MSHSKKILSRFLELENVWQFNRRFKAISQPMQVGSPIDAKRLIRSGLAGLLIALRR